MWEIGAARTDITAIEPGSEMLGWAQPTNRVRTWASRLFSRAIVIHDRSDGRTIVLATLEVCMIPWNVRDAVLHRIAEHPDGFALEEHDLLIASTHTHSGPGGFSHDLFYTMTTPGFRERVFETIVDQTVHAILEAWHSRRVGVMRLTQREIPLSEPVAFNRSWDAFNANPDAFARVDEDDRDRAVDRRMTLIRFDEPDGTPIATMNWFAVHCTSVHADNHFLHSDNKGMAALEIEDHGASMGQPGYVAVFAQGAAGDVSPNLRWDPERGRNVGLHDDDFRSAAANGAIQAEHARRLLGEARREDIAHGPVDAVLKYVDFHYAPVDAKWVGGVEGRHTGLARMGMPFLEGTLEGPGPLLGARKLTEALTSLVRWQKRRRARRGSDPDGVLDSHGPMAPFLELGRGGEGKAFGAFSMGRPILPGWFDPTVAEVKRLTKLEALGGRAWVPHRLPVQIVRLGTLAIAALPCEPTTMCGMRIERQLKAALADVGVEHVVVAGYANSYASYVTTYEEYQLQRYEGGSTLFGQWTLGAYQTAFDDLATAMHAPANERRIDPGPRPPAMSDHELDARHPDRIPARSTWFR